MTLCASDENVRCKQRAINQNPGKTKQMHHFDSQQWVHFTFLYEPHAPSIWNTPSQNKSIFHTSSFSLFFYSYLPLSFHLDKSIYISMYRLHITSFLKLSISLTKLIPLASLITQRFYCELAFGTYHIIPWFFLTMIYGAPFLHQAPCQALESEISQIQTLPSRSSHSRKGDSDVNKKLHLHIKCDNKKNIQDPNLVLRRWLA